MNSYSSRTERRSKGWQLVSCLSVSTIAARVSSSMPHLESKPTFSLDFSLGGSLGGTAATTGAAFDCEATFLLRSSSAWASAPVVCAVLAIVAGNGSVMVMLYSARAMQPGMGGEAARLLGQGLGGSSSSPCSRTQDGFHSKPMIRWDMQAVLHCESQASKRMDTAVSGPVLE